MVWGGVGGGGGVARVLQGCEGCGSGMCALEFWDRKVGNRRLSASHSVRLEGHRASLIRFDLF